MDGVAFHLRAAQVRREAVAQRQRADDICGRLADTLSGFYVPVGDRDRRFLLRLGRSRPLLRFVRHDLRRWLDRSGLPAEVVTEVVLACSEACANALEHPEQAQRQLVEIQGELRDAEIELRVRDFGSWSDRPGSRSRGRGLDLIRGLTDSLEILQTGEGTELVMRRSL
jgi:anti-sigma regulatory factor (Ser/Thr protein kinase)